MTQQLINCTPANSLSGDPLNLAFAKVNANFTELYAGGGGGSSGAVTLPGGSTTDNAAILQAYIDAERLSLGGSGTLRIAPNATGYLVNSQVTTYANDVDVICEGGVQWLTENCGTDAMVRVVRYSYSRTPVCPWDGGIFLAVNAGIQPENNNTGGAGHAIHRVGSAAFLFDGSGSINCSDIIIRNVHCFDFDTPTTFTDNCYNFAFVDCRFRGNKGACINGARENAFECMRWVRCQLSACNYPFYFDLTFPGGTGGLGSGSNGGSLFLIDCIGDYHGIQNFYRGCNPYTADCNNALSLRGGHWETSNTASGTGPRINASGIINVTDAVFYEQGTTPDCIIRLAAGSAGSFSACTIIHGPNVNFFKLYNPTDTTTSTVTNANVRRVAGKGLRRNGAYSTPILADANGVISVSRVFIDYFTRDDGQSLSLNAEQAVHFCGGGINMVGNGSEPMTVALPTTEQLSNYSDPIEFVLMLTQSVTFTRNTLPLYLNGANVASFVVTGQGKRVVLQKSAAAWQASIFGGGTS